MDRAFLSGASGTPPAAPGSPSIGYARSGDPLLSIPATKPGPWWYHMMTEELLAVAVAGGLTPDQNTLTQVRDAINMMIRSQAAVIGVATRTGTDVYTADLVPDITALGAAQNGLRLCLRATAANTTTAPTLTVDAMSSRQIVKLNNVALAVGEIAGAAHWLELIYDQTNNRFVLLNPAPVAAGDPVGSLIIHTGNTAPAGYVKANGALLSRTTFADLFNFANGQGLVSEATWSASNWGRYSVGDGSTTFRVPDARGEFLRGWDDGRGVDSSRAFGSYQADDLKSHSHTWSQPTSNTGGALTTVAINTITGSAPTTQSNPPTQSAGGAETRPRSLAYLVCIKF